MPNPVKTLSSATAWVAPDLLKALAILSDTTVRWSPVDQEDLVDWKDQLTEKTFCSTLFLCFCVMLEREVLEITIHTNINFYSHLKQLCKKVANKRNTLTRISPYLDKKQINLLYNSSFKEQLSYCPLIWTFCSMRSNILNNKLQQRALRVVYNYYDSSFNKHLEIANENTIHVKNIYILITEIYKILHGLSPTMSDVFKKKKDCPYSLRNPRSLIINCKSTVKYGIDLIVYKGTQILQNLSTDWRTEETKNR